MYIPSYCSRDFLYKFHLNCQFRRLCAIPDTYFSLHIYTTTFSRECQNVNAIKITYEIFLLLKSSYSDTSLWEYRSCNGIKRNNRKCEDWVTFMSCRCWRYAVLRLHMAHAHTSRTFALMPNSSLKLYPFSGWQSYDSFGTELVNRLVDGRISHDTASSCKRHSPRSADVHGGESSRIREEQLKIHSES